MTRYTIIALALALTACAQTNHATVSSDRGAPVAWEEFEAGLHEPGPIELERIVTASWEVPLGGLLNLDHEHAKSAGLENEPEPIEVYMYAIHHPEHGLFLIDTGVDDATARRDTKEMAAGWLVRSAMKLEALDVHISTRNWLAAQNTELAGVFLTHLHLDHSMGLPDIPNDVPIFTGPGEAADSKFLYAFGRRTTKRALRGKAALQELQMHAAAGSPFVGLNDVFGDGSLIAVHIPGHTAGSLAFVVRTTEGAVLLTGDGSHTAWGWDHHVEPGNFNTDPNGSADSLARLLKFADAHPTMQVHLGHQPHPRNERTATLAAHDE